MLISHIGTVYGMKDFRHPMLLYGLGLILIAAGIAAALLLHGASSTAPPDGGIRITDQDFAGTPFPLEGHTAIFTANVSADTPYILVDLNSGDLRDSLSLSIISPDQVLGPYTDISDGKLDGRIYLKIAEPSNLTPGRWKFVVHSNNTIMIGSAGQYPWNDTGLFDHKPDN